MQNRTTFMERINERVCAVEDILKKMEPVEDLLERLSVLENNIYTTKKVLTFSEACVYMGVSESLLYKLTAAQEVPHYKPRGKMLYFNPNRSLEIFSYKKSDCSRLYHRYSICILTQYASFILF